MLVYRISHRYELIHDIKYSDLNSYVIPTSALFLSPAELGQERYRRPTAFFGLQPQVAPPAKSSQISE